MKKIFTLAVLALTVLACNKEIAEKQIAAPNEGLMTISATTEDLSKVVLDMNAEVNLTWADTDVITVYDGSAANPFTIKSNSGASAVFEGTCDTAASMLYAVYPAAAYAEPAADAIKVVVPATQTIPDGGCVDADALVAVGYAAPGQPMAFKQVCALLKLTVTGSDIMEIVIRGKGLAGTAAVNADGTINASGASLTDEITLHTAAGMFAPGDYFVAVAPGTTPAGAFSINYNTVSATASKTASSEVNFVRAKGLDAGPLTGFSKTVVITTMAELFNWNASRSTADIEDVKIGADIDMEGEPWTPKDFTGTFDGQGHKLYNLNVNRPSNACFFNTVNGTVKDVIFGSSNGTSYDGSSAIVQDNPEDDGASWRYAGVVTRLSEGSVLENVKNFAPVTVAATSLSKTRVGGLVGVVAGAATVKNCVNYGDVTNAAASPSAAGAIGGLIGWTDAAVTVVNSINAGNVTVNNAVTTYAGGILSTDEVGGTFSNCENKGNVLISASGSKAMCIGGILGDATLSSVVDCTNSGSITCLCDGEQKMGGIIGRAYNGCTVDGCENAITATISFNPSTTAAQTYIGGIVGNAPAANNGTLSIKGCKNYAPLSSTHINVANLGGIAGMLNMTGGTLIIEGCHNYGEIRREVSVTTKGANTDVSVGGILAYARPLAGSKVKDCVNHAAVWTNTNNGSTVIRIGGIVGYSYQNLSVVSCINEGAVTYENHDESVVGSTVHIGGIVAHPMRNSSIDACKNTGNISANRRQVNRAGGIVGTLNNSSLSNCENTGSVSVIVPEELGNWQSVGGIVGFGEGSGSTEKSLENNINRGSVTVKVNTNQARMAVGGIIGMPYTAFTMKGNKNYGAVSGQNSHTTSPYCYVGGIFGLDSSAGNASSISDNSNYGAISIESGNPSFSAAGGLFGDFGKASAASGSNFGSVTASVAGAVAGKNASSITVTICDAVTVNGVTKAAASDEGAWLCPSNTGTIIPTYVAHSNSE